MKDTSYKTAIKRRKFSKPTLWLIGNRSISHNSNALDYGCGKGFDSDLLEIDGYDPYYRPHGLIIERKYSTIICNYVLNVIRLL